MTSGSADIVQVNFGALQASAEALSMRANQLTQNIAQLTSGVQPLKATWADTGSGAGEAYNAAESKLKAAINDIIETIAQFSRTVSDANDMQRNVEAQNTSMFTG